MSDETRAPREEGSEVPGDEAAVPPPAEEPSAPGLPEPAPERASRRVAQSGVRVGTRLAAATLLAALVPAIVASSALLVGEPPLPPPPRVTPPDGLAEDLRRAEAAAAALDEERTALRRRLVELERTRVVAALQDAAPLLVRRIAEARDARKAAGARGDALREPFTLAELRPVLDELGVAEGSRRFIVRRDGTIVAPQGATLASGLDVSTEGLGVDPLAEVVEADGERFLVARRCVAREDLCLVEERALGSTGADLTSIRAGLTKARALLEATEDLEPAPSARAPRDLAWTLAGGSLVLALLLGTLLARRLYRELTGPLAALEGRLRLLATGRITERKPLRRPAELEALEDAVDALGETLHRLEQAEEEAHERARRLYHLADLLDKAAKGKLSMRAPGADDVAEDALADAINRVLEAFERHIVRLKSHLLALSSEGNAVGGADGETEEATEGLKRRVQALRPVPALLSDIAQRLAALAKLPAKEARVPGELLRLSEAIGQRARTAQALYASLEAEATRVKGPGEPTSSGLSERQKKALEALAKDLEALSVDESLPTLVESLPELGEDEITARVASSRESA